MCAICVHENVEACKCRQACGNVLRRQCYVQLQFSHNSQVGLLDLLDGNADVALAKADITADMEATHQISSMDIFKCVTPVSLNCPSIIGSFAHHGTLTHCTCAVELAILLHCKGLAVPMQCHVLHNKGV